jgi:ribosomal protein S18 acetylase RimI-like enzyme
MKTELIKGNIVYLDDCIDALIKSELGVQYFSERDKAKRALIEGFEKGEIYVAVNESNKCVGFIWYIMHGAFHAFPYLHIIAVKEEYRGRGIGRNMIEYFEDILSDKFSKCFLVVADYNPEAKRLYEQIGYTEVGRIPDLYKKSVTEILMMRVLKINKQWDGSRKHHN